MTNYFEVDKVITCSGTAPVASTTVDIYAIKDGKNPLLLKKALAVTGGAWTTTITVPSTYVAPFGTVYLKAVDSFNPTIAGTKFYTIDPTLTMDAVSLTAGIEGTITGTSNYVGQNVEIESRGAGETPEDDWVPFDAVTVGLDGTWEATGTIATAGTYDFRVIDADIDPAVCFAQVDDVVVASGLFVFQFGGSGDDYISDCKKIGNDYYVAGQTKSSTLFGVSTGYSAGGRNFIAKLNSAGVKQWVVFGDYDSSIFGFAGLIGFDTANSKIYFVSEVRSISGNNIKVKKIDYAGTVEATSASFGNINSYPWMCWADGTNFYICGWGIQADDGAGVYIVSSNLVGISFKTLETTTQFNTSSDALGLVDDGTYIWFAIRKYDTNNSYIARYTKSSSTPTAVSGDLGRDISAIQGASSTRILVATNNGTTRSWKMVRKSDLSVLFTEAIDTKVTDPTYYIIPTFDSTSGKFKAVIRNSDNTKLVVYTINDADAYTATTKEIAMSAGTFDIKNPRMLDGIVFATVDGKIISESTDAGGTDCVIYEEG